MKAGTRDAGSKLGYCCQVESIGPVFKNKERELAQSFSNPLSSIHDFEFILNFGNISNLLTLP